MYDPHASVLGTAVLASATSWMVLHFLLGDDPLFHVLFLYRLVDPAELDLLCRARAGGGGLGSVAFVKLLLWLRKMFARLPRWSGFCFSFGSSGDSSSASWVTFCWTSWESATTTLTKC